MGFEIDARIRSAVPTDLVAVRALVEACPLGVMPFRGISGEVRTQHRLKQYHELKPNHELLLACDGDAVVGFAGVLSGLTDGITSERQARVDDFLAEPDVFRPLCEAAAAHASAQGAEYLVAYIGTDDNPHADVLQAMGFCIESHRIAKQVAPPLTESGRRAQDIYRIRPADDSDLFPIALLSTLQSHLGIPAGRTVDPLAVQGRFMESLLGTTLGEDVQILVCEPLPDGDLVGYFYLRLARDESVSDDVIAYIQDFTVHPDHYGIASHLLQYETERVLQKKGIGILVGDISAANPRSLVASTRKAGFAVEANRWGRCL